MTKKKKDTYYIYYSLMKTLKLFCCKRELVLYRIILITRIDLYISEKNERETCSRTCVLLHRSKKLSQNPQISPHTNPFHSTLSITIKWPPPPKHNNNKSLSCVTATVARSSLWSIPKRHPTGRFSFLRQKTGNRCYATRNRAIG